MKIPYFAEQKESWTNFNDDLYNKVKNAKEYYTATEDEAYEQFIKETILHTQKPEKKIAKFIINEKRFVARVWFVITILSCLILYKILS